jgi:hypothetical protein
MSHTIEIVHCEGGTNVILFLGKLHLIIARNFSKTHTTYFYANRNGL